MATDGTVKAPMSENTGANQAGSTRFRSGQSGNPSGKPKGSRNKTTLAVERLLDGEAKALTRKAIELALAGDGPALRLCMDRIAPPRKDRPVRFPLPNMESPGDAVAAAGAIVEAVASGELTPSEAAELSRVVDVYTRAIETTDLEARIARLEFEAKGRTK